MDFAELGGTPNRQEGSLNENSTCGSYFSVGVALYRTAHN